MSRTILAFAAAAVAAGALALPVTAQAATSMTSAGTFRGGSGNYLTSSGTDNLRQVSGSVRLTQTVSGGTISETGTLSGLLANTPYVSVPYKDGECLPLAGVTAFPSSPFTTDATGSVTFTATVNPGAINPTGVLDVNQVHSISVRQVILNKVTVPGVAATPTIPNVGAVEACDRAPVTTG